MTDDSTLETMAGTLDDLAFAVRSIASDVDALETLAVTVDELKTDLAVFVMYQRRVATDLKASLARIEARLIPDNDPRGTERD